MKVRYIITIILIPFFLLAGDIFYKQLRSAYGSMRLRAGIRHNTLFIVNKLDTVSVPIISKRDRVMANEIRDAINKYSRKMSARIGKVLNKRIVERVPPGIYYRGWFIIRDDKIVNIDSTHFLNIHRTRHSLTKGNGYYWSLMAYRLAMLYNVSNDTYDSTDYKYLISRKAFRFLVPMTATKDSLRNYLNDTTSVPRWTGKEK